MIQAYWEGVKNCLVWTESLKCLTVENLEEGRGKKMAGVENTYWAERDQVAKQLC